MNPNPLHGAIDETQPHSATEGGVSEKLRQALLRVSAECHRAKWAFEETDAFEVLDRIGEEARAALADTGGEWRPIESAPKDGTCVLGFVSPHATLPLVMFWSDEHNEWQDEELAIFRRKPESGVRISLSPTHWRPLPAPPSPKDG